MRWGSQARRRDQPIAGGKHGCRSSQLVDALFKGVAGVLEEDDLQQDISVEELHNQKDDQEDIGSGLYSGAEVAVEKDGSNNASGEQTGDIPSQRGEHAENRWDEVEDEGVANNAHGLDGSNCTSLVIMKPPRQLSTVG